MEIHVIGANGMLGRDFCAAAASAGFTLHPWDLPELDITKSESLEAHLTDADWIVNCSAFTRVDDAETERDAAFAINADGVRNLAQIGSHRGIGVVHISTDYVFDGTARRPYTEADRVNPLSVYGASKLAGEKVLRAAGGTYQIIRTQSLFGKHGPNFVKAIVNKLKTTDDPLRVVNNQTSAPTYTRHLATAIIQLIHADAEGLFHVTASGGCTWYDFACAIAERIKPGHPIIPVPASEYARPATRPMYGLLNNERYEKITGHAMPTWESGLDAYLEEEEYFT
jgi:dTDP-4-dehydrorhamnose reductase